MEVRQNNFLMLPFISHFFHVVESDFFAFSDIFFQSFPSQGFQIKALKSFKIGEK